MKYRVTAPDGNKIIINAPEDASQEELISYAQQNYDPKSGMVDAPRTVPPQQEGTTFSQFTNAALQGFAQGATLGFSDELAGVAGILTPGRNYEEARDVNRQAISDAKIDHPMFTTAMEMVGSMGPAAWGSQLIKSIKAAAAIGAVEGSIYGYGTSENPNPISSDTLVGLLLGLGGGTLGEGVSRGAKKLFTTSHPTMRSRVEKADELGYPLSLSERTGSEVIKKLESTLDDYPLSMISPHESFANRQPILNSKVLKDMGISGDTIPTAKLKEAKESIGDVFNKFVGGDEGKFHKIPIDGYQAFDDIANEAHKGLLRDKSIIPIIKNFKKEASDGITPQQYMDFHSELSAKAHSEFTSPQGSRRFAKDLKDVMAAMDEVVKPHVTDGIKGLEEARRKYRTYLAANKGQAIDRSSGDVNIKTMLNNLNRNSIDEGDLVESLLVGKAFPPNTYKPNTGSGVLQIAGTLGSGGYIGNLVGNAGLGGGTAAVLPPMLSLLLRGANKLVQGKHAPIDNLLNILLNQEETEYGK